MSKLQIYQTVLPQDEELLSEGSLELFLIPNYFTEESVVDLLRCIRNYARGPSWHRMNRTVVNHAPYTLENLQTLDIELPNELKYIVTKTADNKEEIFLFSKSVNHDCFRQVETYFEHSNDVSEYRRCIGAGFTNLKTCYGRSESLNINSRPEDTNLLLNFLNS